ALAELAFADDQSTAKLNALVHPPTIIAARQLIVETLAAGELPLIEMPFPTIYLSEIFQLDSTEVVIWTVTADKETRLERGIADGYSYKDALRRMDRQPRMSAYQTEADAIIENSDGLDDLRLEVQMTLESSPL
ncbi:MAG: dephospho-CoA kinase, partial [Coriobacteriia bacterium]|nr:dephospho-CoA kinase [Coriobacteriia bacterium]